MECTCKREWFFDFETECFRYLDGSAVECLSFYLHADHEDIGSHEAWIYRCACGLVNSMEINCAASGYFLLNKQEWKKVLWEDKEHAWSPARAAEKRRRKSRKAIKKFEKQHTS